MKTLTSAGLLVASAAFADAESTSTAKPMYLKGMPTSIALAMLASTSGYAPDFRSMKVSGGADGGPAPGEPPALPKMNYIMARGSIAPLSPTTVSVMGMHSLDSEASRTLAGAFGRSLILPGTILHAKVEQAFTERWYASLNESWVDTQGASDPGIGVGYRKFSHEGFAGQSMLSFSLPVTERSRRDNVHTRTSLRGLGAINNGHWVGFASGSYSRSFAGPSSAPRDRGTLAPRGLAHNGGIKFDELDLLTLDREVDRSSVGIGAGYRILPSLRARVRAGLSILRMHDSREIWITSLRPVSLNYRKNSWAVGTDLGFVSSISDYKRPSWPKLWTLSLNVGYCWGQDTPQIL